MKQLLSIPLLAILLLLPGCKGANKAAEAQKVRVTLGNFKQSVQSTGTVQPLNKVQILPPVAGRMDTILAMEGTWVKKGQIIAWMSSSDRAALLDTARAKGEQEVKYWQDSYKATPIIAPVNGLIISRNVVEGETVSMSTDLYDLSDRLIVMASVDETDLGKIHMGQKADVTVDAYPDKPFQAEVGLIGHQAVKVNNVVSYYVRLDPVKEPGRLRAGMTANVDFILLKRQDLLVLPSWAVKGAENSSVELKVLVEKGKPPQVQKVKLGSSDGAQVEILEGLKENDIVMLDAFKLEGAATGGPFSTGGKSGQWQGGSKGGGGQGMGGRQGGQGGGSRGGR